MPGGGGKGKGGGGSADIDVTSTSTSTNTMDIVGLDDVNVTAELKLPQPLQMNNKMELALPQPFKTDTHTSTEMAVTQPIVTQMTSAMTMDVKPVDVDMCLTLRVAKLPNQCITQPYHRHFGISVLGMEVLGFTRSGESRVIVEDVVPRVQVAWGGESAFPGSRPRHRRMAGGAGPDRGLRIRVGE